MNLQQSGTAFFNWQTFAGRPSDSFRFNLQVKTSNFGEPASRDNDIRCIHTLHRMFLNYNN